MTTRAAWAVLVAALVAAHGCGNRSPQESRPPAEAWADSALPPIPVESPPSATASAALPDTTALAGGAEAPADTLPLVSLRTLLTGDVEVGGSVRVEGVCIGYSRVQAVGPQPRTRSDWQLVDDSFAVWVVGPYPQGCSGTVPSQAAGIYTMTVAMDTLPELGDAPARPRVYLIHTPM